MVARRRKVAASCMHWTLAMCLIVQSTPRLVADEQTVADKAWTILDAGLQDKKTENRVEAILALGLVPKNKKAVKNGRRCFT